MQASTCSLAAQRRAHLVVRVERPQAFVGEREVVRADFGRSRARRGVLARRISVDAAGASRRA